MDTTIRSLGARSIPSPVAMSTVWGDQDANYTTDTERVRYRIVENTGNDLPDLKFERAGAREKLFFEPKRTRAAIVTCGGLCPGLNNVIRSAFLELHYRYGVPEVLGIRYGFAGLNPAVAEPPLRLTPERVDHIHEHGGTVLGTSRGPQPIGTMVDYLAGAGIDILLCVGGDGTLKGAQAIADEASARGLPISVVGIPKTIDNDVMYVSRTFGVLTAVERARHILECAHMEARSAYNGVGLVKVMGRHAGFVACGATVASQEVNFALIPEVPFVLEGANGFLAHLQRRLEARQHAVVVVAEGAGQDLLPGAGERDRSGNLLLQDIGVMLKRRIVEHAKAEAFPVDVKYFDPSYYVRSVAANSEDAVFCDQLARHAVHAAMAGKTAMVVSYWNGTFMHVPIDMVTSGSKQVDLEGPLWAAVLAATGQPKRFG
jgi:6-phosphofructokinase 1